jgi:nucleoside-diphosphate-sugar epimerase
LKKKYLVTGGTGFIGSALARRLVSDGYRVRVFDNDLRGKSARLSDIASEVEFATGDVRNVSEVCEAARGCHSILHLAALNGTPNFYARPELVLDIGIRGMHAALEAARINGIDEFVLASSSEVYQTPPSIPTPESVPLMIPDPWNPRYSYAGSKLISEIMLANYHRNILRRVMIFRAHNVYGPDMGWEHVLPQLILRARDQVARHPVGGVPIEIEGDGSQSRSFTYIDDCIDGLVKILRLGAHRQIYHVGTMEEVTIRNLAERVLAWFGREASIQPRELPEGSTKRRCPDISKLAALGYAPKISLEEGIAQTAQWYVANADQRPNATWDTVDWPAEARISITTGE